MSTDAQPRQLAPRDLSHLQLVTRLEESLRGMEARYNLRFDGIDKRYDDVDAKLTDIQTDLTDTRLLVAGIQGERKAERRESPNVRRMVSWTTIIASVIAAIGGIYATFTAWIHVHS